MKTTIFSERGHPARAAPVAAGEESDVDDDFAGEHEIADDGSDTILSGVTSAEVDDDDEKNLRDMISAFSGTAFNISEDIDLDSAHLRDLLDENPQILPKPRAELARDRPSTPVEERPLEEADWMMM